MGGQLRANLDPAPTMMEPAEEVGHPLPRRRYVDPRLRGRGPELTDLESRRWASRAAESRVRSRPAASEPIGPGRPADPFVQMPSGDGPNFAAPGDDMPRANQSYRGGPPTDAPFVDHYSAQGDWSETDDGGYGQYDEYGANDQYGQCNRCPDNRLFPCVQNWWSSPGDDSDFGRNFTTYTTAQGFKSPVDRGVNGNFGFGKGVNWAIPVARDAGLGFQAGADLGLERF